MHIYMHAQSFKIFLFITVYPRTSHTIPCAIKQDLVLCLSVQRGLYLLTPNSQPSPLPTPPRWRTRGWSLSVSLFCRKARLCQASDSTYKQCHAVFVLFLLISLSETMSRSVHVGANGIGLFIFMVRTIPLYICTPSFFYPFICPWTQWLLPLLSYCEQSCCEYRGTCIFLNYSFSYGNFLNEEIGAHSIKSLS